MYLDFDDRPDVPRVPSSLTIRDGLMASLLAHVALALLLIFGLPSWLRPAPAPEPAPRPPQRVIRYVEMLPRLDRMAPPKRPADPSDLDRQSATRLRAPRPENTAPLSRGNTTRKVEGGPKVEPARPTPPTPPAPQQPQPAPPPPPPATTTLSDTASALVRPPAPTPSTQAANLGRSLRNLQQYLRPENFDNPNGGRTDQNADIQFDSMGVDFGPWLRRFKAQIEHNWLVPTAAELLKGRVVIQFYVLRNGTITGLRVVQPSAIEAFTISALNALKLSNPTAALPGEYPADQVLFTVTFHYNELPDAP
jgi:TonB family protein